MSRPKTELTKTEWILMKRVWELKRTNVREVYEDLLSEQGWAYNTVRTMLERLRDKGFLSAKKVGNGYIYSPKFGRKALSLEAVRSFADRVFDGAVGPIVTHLIREDHLSPSELDEIRSLIDRKEEKP